jgi:hypothetical protein
MPPRSGAETRGCRFFGSDADLRSNTEAGTDGFRTHYPTRTPKLAAATGARRLKAARMFFDHAHELKLIPSNPLADLTLPNVVPAGRRHYVGPADTAGSSRLRPAVADHRGPGPPRRSAVPVRGAEPRVGSRQLRDRPEDGAELQDGAPPRPRLPGVPDLRRTAPAPGWGVRVGPRRGDAESGAVAVQKARCSRQPPRADRT